MIKKRWHTFTACTLAVSLLLAGGTTAHASVDMIASKDTQAAWAADIPQLLSRGDHIEGEVIACMAKQMDAAENKLEKKGYDAEGVFEYDENTSADTLRSEDEKSFVIVSDKTKSTEQLLTELSKNPAVIYAEPNYTEIQQSKTGSSDGETSTGTTSASDTSGILTRSESDSPDDRSSTATSSSAADDSNALTLSETGSSDGETSSTAVSSSDTKTAAVGSSDTETVADGTGLQYSCAPGGFHNDVDNASMNIPNWNSPAGNMDNEVVVAVLDSGFDWQHPDLKDKYVTFTEKQQETYGCGKYGYYAYGNQTIGHALNDPSVIDKYEFEHGTHVAGIIAAAWDGAGISGVGSNIKLVNVKVDNYGDGEINTAATLRAYSFVKNLYLNEGIKIRAINNSWGMDSNSQAVNDAVRDLGETCGILSFFSAGNAGDELDDDNDMVTMISSNPYAVLVASTNAKNQLSDYSVTSRSLVDVAAPGEAIFSTIPTEQKYCHPDLAASKVFLNGADTTAEAESLTLRLTKSPEEINGISSRSFEQSLNGNCSFKIPLCTDGVKTDASFTIESDPVSISKPTDFDTTDYTISMYLHPTTNAFDISDVLVPCTDGSWKSLKEQMIDDFTENTMWIHLQGNLPKETDFDHFRMKCMLLSVNDADGPQSIYIDSVGIVSQQTAYHFMSGTSMSCPAAVGACAVIASDHPGYTASDLKAALIGSSRPVKGFEEKIQCGGMIDLSIPESSYCPSVTDVSTSDTESGSKLTINGYYFGPSKGTLTAQLYSGGTARNISLNISAWSKCRITASADSRLTGCLVLTVTASNGRKFCSRHFLGASDSLFETNLSLPDNTGSNPYLMDRFTDNEPSGTLLGIGSHLYFLQDVVDQESVVYAGYIWAYDINTDQWGEPVALKEPLAHASAAVYDGKILIEGTTLKQDSYTKRYYTPNTPKEKIYLYNPQSSNFKELNSSKVAVCASVVSQKDKIYVVANSSDTTTAETGNLVCEYDPTSGSIKETGTLYHPVSNPRATASNDEIYLYCQNISLNDTTYEYSYVDTLQAVNCSSCIDLSYQLPKYELSSSNFPPLYNYNRKYSLTAVPGGFIMAGLCDKTNHKSTWTYQLATNTLTPLDRQITDYSVNAAALCAYGGRLYAIAAATDEPSGCVFRSTECQTILGPGSLINTAMSCTSPTYNGTSVKPTNVKVILDGTDITSRVNIKWSNNVNAGAKAKAVITPKSGETTLSGTKTALFTIKKGSTSFTAKAARTSISVNTLKKKAQAAKITVTKLSKGSTKPVFAVQSVSNSQKNKVSVNSKTGLVTVKKGTKKCKIVISATSKANTNRKAAAKKMTITVK